MSLEDLLQSELVLGSVVFAESIFRILHIFYARDMSLKCLVVLLVHCVNLKHLQRSMPSQGLPLQSERFQ